MRDEAYEREPQQRAAPFGTTPTQTASIFQTANDRSEPPVPTAVAKEPETSTFVLGTDTCGFTNDSTITCDFGNECTNIDSYRGCCTAGGTDCSATIYTTCVDYAEMPNAAMCGPQTLCCPLSSAYCATYGFMTEEQPDATLTYVHCAESPRFGELYAYPPEQATTTTESPSMTESASSTLAIDPVESTHSSSSRSVSSGTIAGATVGGVIFLLLVILGIFQIFNRRRRQGEENTSSGGGTNSTPSASTEKAGFGPRLSAGRLSSPSMIHEQQAHSPLSASSRDRRRSVSRMLQRQSFGPNWPLGPMSPKNPLSSHPVVDLEKRINPSSSPPQPNSNQHRKVSMPALRIPTPPLPGPRLTQPSLNKSQYPLMFSGAPVLQSPRLSVVPPPAIDAAFEEEVERTLNGVGGPSTNALNQKVTSSSVAPLLTAATSAPEAANTTIAVNKKGLMENGFYINAEQKSSGLGDREPVSPLSPLNEDDNAPSNQQLSFMPAQSISHNRSQGEVGGSVSPISCDGVEARLAQCHSSNCW
ncbi:hypothetical protein F4803DRAFT_546236 [Xylaria telfairii]|nr:hypothetical protein F4803DRAFT_546236 [Xylaria telfairii]